MPTMIPENTINPFEPGPGKIPPVFPGREHEQYQFMQCVNRLKHNIAPSHDIIICAPRGNGKTALLTWLEKETSRQAANNIHVIDITPDEIKTIPDLINILAPSGHKRNLLSRLEGSIKATAPPSLTGIPADASISAKLNPKEQVAFTTVAAALTHCCLRKPTLLIVDEAHNLEQPVAQALLNASQKTRKKAPFLLVMAGTPGLRNHLSAINATFWERNDILQPGLLTWEDAYKAIAEPLETFQVTHDQGILKNIAQDSQGYPYFTQLWGEKLFILLQLQKTGHINNEIAQLALKDIRYKQQIFYQGRYDRLDKLELIPIATAVAEHYEKQAARDQDQILSQDQIEEILDTVTLPAGHTIKTAQEELINEGYIWRADPANQKVFHPGIPSLMAYIKTQAPAIST